MNDQQAILDFQRLADKVTAPSKLEYWSERARILASKLGYPVVVVNMRNGAYELYPKSIATKWGREWDYCTDGEA